MVREERMRSLLLLYTTTGNSRDRDRHHLHLVDDHFDGTTTADRNRVRHIVTLHLACRGVAMHWDWERL